MKKVVLYLVLLMFFSVSCMNQNEVFNKKISFEKRSITNGLDPGKFDHLPDPELGSAFRDWPNDDIIT
jgi:hypothetical protein